VLDEKVVTRLIPACRLNPSEWLLDPLECLLHERLEVDSLRRNARIDRLMDGDQTP